MQLTKEQRIFIVVNFLDSYSMQHVQELFQERFPERNSPLKVTIWKNVTKYKTEGTSLNLNKGRSGRKNTERAPENVEIVHQALLANPDTSSRKNGSGKSKSTFNRIVKLELKWHPYKCTWTRCFRDHDGNKFISAHHCVDACLSNPKPTPPCTGLACLSNPKPNPPCTGLACLSNPKPTPPCTGLACPLPPNTTPAPTLMPAPLPPVPISPPKPLCFGLLCVLFPMATLAPAQIPVPRPPLSPLTRPCEGISCGLLPAQPLLPTPSNPVNNPCTGLLCILFPTSTPAPAPTPAPRPTLPPPRPFPCGRFCNFLPTQPPPVPPVPTSPPTTPCTGLICVIFR
ncbi:Protein of unknown function DUF4817 [Trinorchestia longiramus]|nr:Protein of unknown function DUF4817 [Trinorchestia longiramus]